MFYFVLAYSNLVGLLTTFVVLQFSRAHISGLSSRECLETVCLPWLLRTSIASLSITQISLSALQTRIYSQWRYSTIGTLKKRCKSRSVSYNLVQLNDALFILEVLSNIANRHVQKVDTTTLFHT